MSNKLNLRTRLSIIFSGILFYFLMFFRVFFNHHSLPKTQIHFESGLGKKRKKNNRKGFGKRYY